jgi:sigma-B regulation protein RsbU (phosphoserine phosphatase)
VDEAPSERAPEGQRALEVELRILRRLHELERRFHGCFSLQTILQRVVGFATRELGYQRSAVFLDDRNSGIFTVRAFDGFPREELRRPLASLAVPSAAWLPARLRENPRVVVADRAPSELAPLAAAMSMDRFLALPLIGVAKNLIGFLVAGTQRGDQDRCSPLDEQGLFAAGLADLAEKASSALNHCLLHWELAVERNLLEAKVSERTAELEAAYAKIAEDLEQARDFQQSILPAPPPLPELDIEVIYRPQGPVGGDLYDVEMFDDGHLQLFVADATGHGVTASLTTMFIKGEYDRVKRGGGGPAEILRRLNDQLARTYGHLDMRFTAVCVTIDMSGRVLHYSCAAHPAPYHLHEGKLVELDGGGPFMGLVAEVSFPEWVLPFAPDDGIYLFTDGVVDEWNACGEAFGDQRVRAAIQRAIRQGGPAGHAVCAELDEFVGQGKPQYDDITFVGATWRQGGTREL